MFDTISHGEMLLFHFCINQIHIIVHLLLSIIMLQEVSSERRCCPTVQWKHWHKFKWLDVIKNGIFKMQIMMNRSKWMNRLK